MNSDIIIGGIVTSYREGLTKKGTPFGIITIEDYSGTAEIPLFSKDYINFGAYGKEGLYLLVQGKVEIAKYNNRPQLRIGKISLMDESMANLIKDITIVVDSENFDSSKANAVNEIVNRYIDGAGQLKFEIQYKSKGYIVPLYSRSKKVKIDRELVSALESIEGVSVKVNGRSIERKVEEIEEILEEEFVSD